MHSHRLVIFATCAAVALGLLLPAAPSHACGGLFCNSPPPNPFDPLPVAQTGENVVFAVDRDAAGMTTVEAHIQILYQGPADKFSWVVPVDAVPTLGTGTDRLFTALTTPTNPQFQADYVVDGTCISPPTGSGGFASGADAGVNTGTGAGGSTGSGGVPGVNIAFQGAVGPFDAAVIQSDDPMALKTWLSDNGYYLGNDASVLIDDYVREGKYFVALKLLNGKDVRAIQPIVLTFHNADPCVPLRLTAIAAFPDMRVTVWVLGPSRAVPKRFFELKINEARINWPSFGSNYQTLLGEAANEAGGNAFIAEYAGPSTVARGALWLPGQFDLTALRAAQTPPAYLQALVALGLANDPQMLPLLTQYIPMPDEVKALGITEAQFYGNISVYWSAYAFPPFDLVGLTNQISTVIIEPRRVAQAMVDAHPYLTRLNTFLSPEEMTQDPYFIFNTDLPDVSNFHRATIRTMCGNRQFLACNAPMRLELSDGRIAWLRAGSTSTSCQYLPYDDTLKTLPAAEVVWAREDSGEGARRVDNNAAIVAALTQHNSAFPAESRMFPIPAPGAMGQTPPDDNIAMRGCGCTLGGGGARPLLAVGALGALVGLGLRRRRRRR